MLDKLGAALKQPFYLWLLGTYPILHLYSENLGLVKDHEVIYVCAGMLAATTLAFLLSNRSIRSRHKTAFMLGICNLVFSLSGHAYALLFMPRSLFVWTMLLLAALAILLAILWRRVSKQVLEPVTPALNLILLALLAIPSAKIVSSYVSESINVQPISAFADAATRQDASPKVQDSPTHPDIYYIIPDGYSNDSLLRKGMGYDNSAFSKALEERGFIVVDHAQNNYRMTLLALASILNMQYFEHNPSTYGDLDYLRISIADNKVARQLQQFGYTYVQLLSGYWMPNPNADIIRDFAPAGTIEIVVNQSDFSTAIAGDLPKKKKPIPNLEQYYKQSFTSLYLNTTLFRIVHSQLKGAFIQNGSIPYNLYDPERFLDTVDEVESIVRMPEATFAVIHLLKPHNPIVFNEHGEFLGFIWKPNKEETIAQFKFINSKFLEMIDTILEESQHPPVIVFQADHSSIHIEDINQELYNPVHFAPYAAYYLPDVYSISFPEPFTLINTFPLLFNEIFEINYGVNDDRLFETPFGYKAPFKQQDLTARYLGK